MRRGIHQYSLAGIPPIGPIPSSNNRSNGKMDNVNNDFNNNNSNSSNNNNNDGSSSHYCSNSNQNGSLSKFNALPPISKIPGLNPDSDVIAAAEKKVFRTFKIHDSDSSYVKLAKQGGRKNLLEYKEFDKENVSLNTLVSKSKKEKVKRPTWLEHDEEKVEEADKSPTLDDINNNNVNKSYFNKNAGAGKSIIQIKKQAKMLKDRPDLLPVDNTEILKHLNAPKRPMLPKIGYKSRLAPRFVRVAGR